MLRLKRVGVWLTAASVLMCAQAALAADEAAGGGGGEGGDAAAQLTHIDLGTMTAVIVVFVLLVIVLRFTAWKPILGGLKAREEAIRDSIEGAKKAKTETERVTKELQDKIATVQRQALAELTQVKADAVKLGEVVRQQAEAEAAALKDRTLREIEAAKQQALNEINTRVVALGTAIAGKILQRNVNVDDQQRLVDESLGELAKKN